MVRVINRSAIFCLVVHICLTCGILTTNFSDSSRSSRLSAPIRTYLPAAVPTYPKQPQHVVYAKHSHANGLGNDGAFRGYIIDNERTSLSSPYADLRAKESLEFLKEKEKEKWRLIRDEGSTNERANTFSQSVPARSIVEINRYYGTTMKGMPGVPTLKTPMAGETLITGYAPRRSSYRITESPEECLADDGDHSKSPCREKIVASYHHGGKYDITTAIKTLDRFLSGMSKDDSYNSELHPPPNPILALILSRYGRYLPTPREPKLYSYMAVNNIHNHQPFGSYKLECDEEYR